MRDSQSFSPSDLIWDGRWAKTVEEIGGTVHAGRSAEGGAEFTLQLRGVTSREAISNLLVPPS